MNNSLAVPYTMLSRDVEQSKLNIFCLQFSLIICAKLISKGAKSNACADALRQERPWTDVPAVPPESRIRNRCYETLSQKQVRFHLPNYRIFMKLELVNADKKGR